MGRKGMKGFLKSAAKPSAKPEEESSEGPTNSAEVPTAASPDNCSIQKQQNEAPTTAAVSCNAISASGVSHEDDESSAQETRGQMLQRHKRVGMRLLL